MALTENEKTDLLEKVRLALRVRTNAFDEGEIIPLIDACVIDLNMSGVNIVEADDPSFVRAVVLYCKAFFGYSEDSEKWNDCYKSLKDSMALSREYGELQNPEES